MEKTGQRSRPQIGDRETDSESHLFSAVERLAVYSATRQVKSLLINSV
jgi:hypothetical protein